LRQSTDDRGELGVTGFPRSFWQSHRVWLRLNGAQLCSDVDALNRRSAHRRAAQALEEQLNQVRGGCCLQQWLQLDLRW
jgi:hypothetical protein